MSSLCRTCGLETFSKTAINIFEENNVIINQIALVTGVQLTDQLDFPKNMCPCCLTSLRKAIKFRELCIATNQLLTLDAVDLESDSKDNEEDMNNPLNSKEELTLQKCLEELIQEVEIEMIEQEQLEIMEDDETYDYTHLHKQQRTKDLGESDDISLKFYDINGNSVETTNTETTSSNSQENELIPEENGHKRARKKYKATRIYFCDQCGKEFNDKANLNLHLVRHTGVKPVECPDCGKREFNTYLMNIHIRVKHRGEKPFACKYCDESFVDSTKRYRHQSRMHELKATNRKIKCAFCDLRFEVQSQLKKHEVVHSGERNFPCEICNVSFTRNFNLKTHFRSRQHKKKAAENAENSLE